MQNTFQFRRKFSRLFNILISISERLLPIRRRECPCCNWKGLYFRCFSVLEYMRFDALCPSCGSLERHRALSYFYSSFLKSLPQPPTRVIHFAPEACLEKSIKPFCKSYEKSSFPKKEDSHLNLDLTHLDLPNESCDIFIMNHVLDCMPDDKPALREMARTLKPNGIVLAIVAIKDGNTFEHPMISNAQFREYGSNNLFQNFPPFQVQRLNIAENLNPVTRRLQGIPKEVTLLVLKK